MKASPGRPPKYNLLRHGFEALAEYAHGLLRRRGGDHAILVTEDGRVRVIPCSTMGPGEHDAYAACPTMLGTYTRKVTIETLEGDLLARLRELNGNMLPAEYAAATPAAPPPKPTRTGIRRTPGRTNRATDSAHFH